MLSNIYKIIVLVTMLTSGAHAITRSLTPTSAPTATSPKCCDALFEQTPRSTHWHAAVREAAFHSLAQRSAFGDSSLDARVERDTRLWTRVRAAHFDWGAGAGEGSKRLLAVRAGALVETPLGRMLFKVTSNYDCPESDDVTGHVMAAWRLQRISEPPYGYTVSVKTGTGEPDNNRNRNLNTCTEDTYRFSPTTGLSHLGARQAPRQGLVYHYTVDSAGGRSQVEPHNGDRRILKPVKFPTTPGKKLLYDAATGKVVIPKGEFSNAAGGSTVVAIEPRKRYRDKQDFQYTNRHAGIEREFISQQPQYNGFLPVEPQQLFQNQPAVDNTVLSFLPTALPTTIPNHNKPVTIYRGVPVTNHAKYLTHSQPKFRPSKPYTIYSEPDPLYDNPIFTTTTLKQHNTDREISDKILVIHRYSPEESSIVPPSSEKQTSPTPVIPFISVTVSNNIPLQNIKQSNSLKDAVTMTTRFKPTETTTTQLIDVEEFSTTTVRPTTDETSTENLSTIKSPETVYENKTLNDQMMTNEEAKQMRNIIKKDTTVASRGMLTLDYDNNNNNAEQLTTTQATTLSTSTKSEMTTFQPEAMNDTETSQLIDDFLRTVIGSESEERGSGLTWRLANERQSNRLGTINNQSDGERALDLLERGVDPFSQMFDDLFNENFTLNGTKDVDVRQISGFSPVEKDMGDNRTFNNSGMQSRQLDLNLDTREQQKVDQQSNENLVTKNLDGSSQISTIANEIFTESSPLEISTINNSNNNNNLKIISMEESTTTGNEPQTMGEIATVTTTELDTTSSIIGNTNTEQSTITLQEQSKGTSSTKFMESFDASNFAEMLRERSLNDRVETITETTPPTGSFTNWGIDDLKGNVEIETVATTLSESVTTNSDQNTRMLSQNARMLQQDARMLQQDSRMLQQDAQVLGEMMQQNSTSESGIMQKATSNEVVQMKSLEDTPNVSRMLQHNSPKMLQHNSPSTPETMMQQNKGVPTETTTTTISSTSTSFETSTELLKQTVTDQRPVSMMQQRPLQRNGRADMDTTTETTPQTTITTTFNEDHSSHEIAPQDLETARQNLASLLTSLTFDLFNNSQSQPTTLRVRGADGTYLDFTSSFNSTENYYDDDDDSEEAEEEEYDDDDGVEEGTVDYDSVPLPTTDKRSRNLRNKAQNGIKRNDNNSTGAMNMKRRKVEQSNSH